MAGLPGPQSPRGEVTLAQAVALALRRNPDLLAGGYDVVAAEARLTQARLRPNPELDIEFENFSGSGERRGSDALETTLSLGQVVELGGKRKLRQEVAQTEVDSVDVEQRVRELDVLSEVTRRFIDVVAAQEEVRFAAESLDLSQRTLDAISARVVAARSPESERSRAHIAFMRARLEAQRTESVLRGARVALASTWGAATAEFTAAKADLFDFGSVQNFEQLLALLRRNPNFLRLIADVRLRDAELRLAQVQSRPNLSLSLGIRRFNQDGDTALVAGFSMPLPLFDRNQGAIREAQARRTQSVLQQEAEFTRAAAILYTVYEEMQSVRAGYEVLRTEIQPQAKLALEQTQYGYERGRFSFLELIAAQRELVELRQAAIDAAADYHRLLAELERLTQEPVSVVGNDGDLP
ncbi:MAG TPA: TolC family protein [Steroidobacteraceae bacterium]|jgi:cobalt-zinc-cadmium efflux system outer membrane protein